MEAMNSRMISQPSVDSSCADLLPEGRISAKILFAFACLALVAMPARATDNAVEDIAAQEQVKKREIHDLIPRLRSLEATRSKDLDAQLGLAVFYRDYHTSLDYFERRDGQYARVLQMDPNNKVIWQMRADDAVGRGLGAQEQTVHYLESLLENAQTCGRKDIDIWTGIYGNDIDPNRPWRTLYKVLGDKSGRSVIIEEKDYDQARAKVRQYADNALDQALKAVDECEKHDPDNAYYDYRKAELYFNLRQPALALRELQVAVRKPFVQAYVDQKEKAVTRALEAADAPAGLFSPNEHRRPASNYIFDFIWRQYVEPLAAEIESEGNLDQANEICTLATGVAKQIREEPLPYDSVYGKRVSTYMEQWATERLTASDKRKAEKSTPPDDGPQNEKK
jgi:tetratricopeptide (TPR) repeat protein